MADLFNNLNKLTVNSAILNFTVFPNMSITLQQFPLPGVYLGAANQSSPFFDKPVYGDKLNYNDLFVVFQVSEDMKNWYEIYKWMYYIGNPIEKPPTLDLTYTDAIMLIHTSHENPYMKVTFRDCVPVMLGDLYFSEQSMETQEMSCTLIMKYQRYDVEFLTQG